MKIIYFLKACARKAGTERVLTDKMNYLAAHGHEIHFVTFSQGQHPLAFPLHEKIRHYDINIRFIDLSKHNTLYRMIGHIVLRRRFKNRLQKLVDEVMPDIFIMTTYQLKQTDLVLAVKTNAVRLIESHAPYECMTIKEEYQNRGLFKFFASSMDSYFIKEVAQFQRLIVLTEGDRMAWKSHGVERVEVIPNPVTSYPETIQEDTNDSRHRIICAGRLHEQKGFDMLIEAFALIAEQCPQWRIDIFGDGEEKENLLQLIALKGLQDRVFINPSTDEIYSEYLNSSFYVLSSRFEGYALVLHEAMSCGIPCVSFRCKYGPEIIITHGEDGLLVDNGDVKKMAEAILWMIQHPQERLLMGRKARQVASRFSKDEIMQRWEQLFKECTLQPMKNEPHQ